MLKKKGAVLFFSGGVMGILFMWLFPLLGRLGIDWMGRRDLMGLYFLLSPGSYVALFRLETWPMMWQGVAFYVGLYSLDFIWCGLLLWAAVTLLGKVKNER